MAMSLPGGWLASKYGSHRTITVGKHAAYCGVASTLRRGRGGEGGVQMPQGTTWLCTCLYSSGVDENVENNHFVVYKQLLCLL